jgi:hypothetical protein
MAVYKYIREDTNKSRLHAQRSYEHVKFRGVNATILLRIVRLLTIKTNKIIALLGL